MNDTIPFFDLKTELENIQETADLLWQKGWAECNGGNISVNLTNHFTKEFHKDIKYQYKQKLNEKYPLLSENYFYITGAGKRMRDVARNSLSNGMFIMVSKRGDSIYYNQGIDFKPSSELPSHLAIHSFFKEYQKDYRVVLHTHPAEIIALTHSDEFLNEKHLTRTLWAMIPEARIIIPKGVGVVDYKLPGSDELAMASIEKLKEFDVIVWEKHGVLCVGDDILRCFDVIDTLTKSASIYLHAKQAGFTPKGLSDKQLEEIKEKYC